MSEPAQTAKSNADIAMLRVSLQECIVLLRGALGIIREDSPVVERALRALDATAPKPTNIELWSAS